MIRSLILLLLPFFANAFSRITSSSSSKQNVPVIVGSTKPIENFDPLNLLNDSEGVVYQAKMAVFLQKF